MAHDAFCICHFHSYKYGHFLLCLLSSSPVASLVPTGSGLSKASMQWSQCGPVVWLPFHPHLWEEPPEITSQSCICVLIPAHACAFFSGENHGRPYGLPTLKQFSIPHLFEFLCQRGWTATNFQFPNFPCLTNEKENILSWIKSKASPVEDPLLFILSHYSCLGCRYETQVYRSHLANLRLQAWNEGLYLQWRGRRLERNSVSEGTHEPPSQLWTAYLQI